MLEFLFGAFVSLVMVLLCALCITAQAKDCEVRWRESGMQAKYDGTCKVNVNGNWLPAEAVKVEAK